MNEKKNESHYFTDTEAKQPPFLLYFFSLVVSFDSVKIAQKLVSLFLLLTKAGINPLASCTELVEKAVRVNGL